MVKSWYPGKVQALAWQSPRRLPGGKLSFGLIPVAFAGRCSPGKRHGEKLVHQVYPRQMPGHQVFYQANAWPPAFPQGVKSLYVYCIPYASLLNLNLEASRKYGYTISGIILVLGNLEM